MHAAPAAALALALLAAPAPAALAAPTGEPRPAAAPIDRGLTGRYTFTHPRPDLRAIVEDRPDAPLAVRLERTRRTPSGDYEYTAYYAGLIEGEHDLTPLITTSTGEAPGLPPMIVRAQSTLPPDPGVSLFDAGLPDPGVRGGYLTSIIVVATAWAAVPVVVGVRTVLRRRYAPPPPPAPPEPTLAQRLRPLLTRAAEGNLPAADLARLEIMLYHHWRDALGARSLDMHAAIALIRRDPAAGRLLRTVEAWLHSGGDRRIEPADIDALLTPYQGPADSPEPDPAKEAAA